MLSLRLSPFLRQLLLLDAATSSGFGLLCLALTQPLANLLAIPPGWIAEAGLICLLFGTVVGWIGYRTPGSSGPIWFVIFGNAAWGLLSIASVLFGWIAPNAAGLGVVIGQGIMVLVLGEMQFLALRGRVAGPIKA